MVLIVSALVSGCAQKKPVGYNQAVVEAKCVDVVALLNEFNFVEIENMASNKYNTLPKVNAGYIDSQCHSAIERLGALRKISTIATDILKDDADDYYTISIVVADHENDWTRYLIVLDRDQSLLGVEMV